MRLFVTVFVALISLSIGPASAALIVAETTDFAPPHPNLPSIGTVMAGVNTVSGSLNGTCVATNCKDSGTDPIDGFNFALGSGLQIISFKLAGLNVTGPQGFDFAVDTHDHGGAPNFTDLNIFASLNGDGSTGNLLGAPVSGDLFGVSVFGSFANQNGPYSLDWTVTIEAAPIAVVPLPNTLILMVSALMAGFLFHRVNSRKSASLT